MLLVVVFVAFQGFALAQAANEKKAEAPKPAPAAVDQAAAPAGPVDEFDETDWEALWGDEPLDDEMKDDVKAGAPAAPAVPAAPAKDTTKTAAPK